MSILIRSAAIAATALSLGATTAFAAVEHCTPRYEIIRGDTLWGIAGAQMGSVFDYVQIHETNLEVIGPNPDLIYAGDMLDIPCGGVELGQIDWSVMPQPAALATLMDAVDIQVIDIRKQKDVAEGVIPGAISLPYSMWQGPAENPGAPKAAEDYAQMLGSAGVRLDIPTVIVHRKAHPMSTGAAAHVYWMLKSLGADQLAILRGGHAAWAAADLPMAETPVTRAAYDPDLVFSSAWRSTEDDIKEIVFGDRAGMVLDARPHKMFSKVDKVGQAIATTIPGAKNLPAPPLMSKLKGEFDIEDGVGTVIDYYRTQDAVDAEGDVITFCHTGQLAALNWFYASELAGIDNVTLYPESLKGWSQSVGILGSGLF